MTSLRREFWAMPHRDNSNNKTLIQHISNYSKVTLPKTLKLLNSSLQRSSQSFWGSQECNSRSKVIKNSVSILILKFFPLITMIILFLVTPALAKDLGVYGETFAIAEENLLTLIHRKLKVMQESGEIHQRQQALARGAATKIQYPQRIKGLVNTIKPRQWLYDPSLRIEEDIKDHQGNLIVAKGTLLNPLDTLSWGAPLLFLDGDDSQQIAWAQTQDPQAKWVLIKGSPLELEKKSQKPIYFDQAGMLVAKFGIQQVPCRMTQQGKALQVEEIKLPEVPHE